MPWQRGGSSFVQNHTNAIKLHYYRNWVAFSQPWSKLHAQSLSLSGFGQPRKGLAKLRHLGCGHRHAIALVRVLGEEVLVVLLGSRIVAAGYHFGHHRLAVCLALGDLAQNVLRHLGLLGCAGVDAAAVLRAHIVALPVQCGWVVDDKEDLQDLFQADFLRVELELHHLVVTGGAGAHLLVAGVDHLAIAVATLHIGDTPHVHKNRLRAPKTTPT